MRCMDNRWSRKIVEFRPSPGKRNTGRRKERWTDDVMREVSKGQISVEKTRGAYAILDDEADFDDNAMHQNRDYVLDYEHYSDIV